MRVGASEYEPTEHIKEFTLQFRCQEIVNRQKIKKLELFLDKIDEFYDLVLRDKLRYQYKFPYEKYEPKQA